MSSDLAAVVIVAYRAAAKLETCLKSIRTHLSEHDVYVWDNSGSDCSDVRNLASRFPEVNWHFSDANIGFAGGVNKIAALLPNRNLLLLNPDAELLGPLRMTLKAITQSGVAAASPMLFASEERRTSWRIFSNDAAPWDSAYKAPSILNFFGGAAGLALRTRGTPLSYRYYRQPKIVTGFLSGACLAISRNAWDAVGHFDEAFFLYQEEAEWQRRATLMGWKLTLADEADVRHVAMGTVVDDEKRFTRSKDLAFASAVLMAKRCFGSQIADLYLVWSLLVDSVKRRFRAQPQAPGMDVMITLGNSADPTRAERIAMAVEFERAGYSVVLVSLQDWGTTPRDVPSSIRLVRRPSWWPSTMPQQTPSLLVAGNTQQERIFSRLFRAVPNRTRVNVNDVGRLLAPGTSRGI